MGEIVKGGYRLGHLKCDRVQDMRKSARGNPHKGRVEKYLLGKPEPSRLGSPESWSDAYALARCGPRSKLIPAPWAVISKGTGQPRVLLL